MIGRTTLTSNPLAQPLISSLESLSTSESNGSGLVLDENGNVIYQTGGSALAAYGGARGNQPSFSNGAAVADLDFMMRAVAFAREHDILLVHDAAYSELALNGFVVDEVDDVDEDVSDVDRARRPPQ